MILSLSRFIARDSWQWPSKTVLLLQKKNLANPWSLPKCIVCPSIRNVAPHFLQKQQAPRPHKSTGIGFSASRRAKRSVAVCTASMADDRVYTEEEVSLPYGICKIYVFVVSFATYGKCRPSQGPVEVAGPPTTCRRPTRKERERNDGI